MTLARIPACANRINSGYKNYTLLDAGCRTMALRPYLIGCSEYFGTDLIPAKGVLQCDLEEPLDFEDNAFDIVTVLDVLEHLNNPHGALKELIRVARKAVFVSLPNVHYIKFRWNFLRGRGVSGKYAFSPDPIVDRHRWMVSHEEALEFVLENARGHHIEHEMILPTRGRTRSVTVPIEKWLGKTWPNLFAYGALFEIKLRKT